MAGRITLKIGTSGWEHDGWLGGFYPDDLPVSWRLDYFSNAFNVVLVPQQAWLAWSQATMQAIAESVESDFGFYFALHNELEGGVKNEKTVRQLRLILSILGSSVLGFVVWSEKAFTLSTLLQQPVTLVSTQHRLQGWSWQNEGLWLSGNPLGFVSRLPKEGKAQVKLLTGFVESLSDVKLDRSDILPVAFIVGGDLVDIQQTANLKTIGELLGY
ncbi:MAG: hypothetical protein L3J00_01290 [Thiomicrorhabdus sp.]|nr:hypothetical protein [Thiomicrorhabdus sp.]